MSIKNIIKELNNPRFGSFGEFLFKKTIEEELKIEIENYHKERADFIVSGKKVDVGSSRRLSENYNINRNYSIRNKNAIVILFNDLILIYYKEGRDELLKKQILYETINNEILNEWKLKKLKIKKNKTDFSKIHNLKIKLKKNLNKINPNIKVRIIYRTVTKLFGLNEGPGNLINTKINSNRLNIYIDFEDYTFDKINFILAFFDIEQDKLKITKDIRLLTGMKLKYKVDLQFVFENQTEFVFKDIEDFTNNIKKRIENYKLN